MSGHRFANPRAAREAGQSVYAFIPVMITAREGDVPALSNPYFHHVNSNGRYVWPVNLLPLHPITRHNRYVSPQHIAIPDEKKYHSAYCSMLAHANDARREYSRCFNTQRILFVAHIRLFRAGGGATRTQEYDVFMNGFLANRSKFQHDHDGVELRMKHPKVQGPSAPTLARMLPIEYSAQIERNCQARDLERDVGI